MLIQTNSVVSGYMRQKAVAPLFWQAIVNLTDGA
jgi:hypothetical protein